MKLKKSVLAKIKKNKELRRALVSLHDNTETTILLWLRTNSPMLCHYSSLQVISAHLKEDKDSLIEYTDADFKQVV